MAMRKSLKCLKCGRRFSMSAHLARHMNSVHGRKRRSTQAESGRGRGRATRSAARSGVAVSDRAADLVSRMQDYHAKLLARRDAIEAEIAAISEAIDAMGATATAPSRERRPDRPAGRVDGTHDPGHRGLSLKSYVLRVLRQRKTPITVRELADAVLRAGYRTKAMNLRGSLSAVLPVMAQLLLALKEVSCFRSDFSGPTNGR